MLIRTDIRTPFGGKPRMLPDVLRRKAVIRRRSAMMADQVSRLVEMSKQRAAFLDAMVERRVADDLKRLEPHWLVRVREMGRVLVFLGSITAAMLLLAWLSRP